MIISRTPYRISFFGGGTDYPTWFNEHGGSVLASSINKYCYLTCRELPPFFEHRYRIVYSRTEDCHTVDDIRHPVVRESLKYLQVAQGIELHHDGDLPARSGMGSSSSFTVGLLHVLHALKGGMVSKSELARQAIDLEQNVLKENVGCQDQILSAFGGFNLVTFHPGGRFEVDPVTVGEQALEGLCGNLMLFFSGVQRIASSVAATYVPSLSQKTENMKRLGSLVPQGLEILRQGKGFDDFGRLLHEAWMIKKGLSASISSDVIEEIYNEAMAAGALGGKLLGAGGGGFLLFYVPPHSQKAVRERLARLTHVPFRFEHHGTQIIFYEPSPR